MAIVYVEDRESRADLCVFVTDRESRADLCVCMVDKERYADGEACKDDNDKGRFIHDIVESIETHINGKKSNKHASKNKN